MIALVTGGNGFLGRYLVPELQDSGASVRVLAIAGEDTTWLEERNVEVFRGDVRDPGTLTEPIRGVDTVFHLASMMGLWRPFADYEAVNVGGTENVALAALSAGVRRMVHVSSWTVYGMNLRAPAHEDSPLRPFPEPYGVTKRKSEDVIQRLAATRGLPAVIVRPDTFFGPGDRLHFLRMADRLRSGRGLVIGSGRNTLPFVYVSDVAHGLVLAAEAREARGQAYNIASDRPVTQGEMLSLIARETGARPPRLHVPYRLMYAASAVVEQAWKVAWPSRQPLVTRLGVNVFGAHNPHSVEKARAELGYEPAVPIEEGVRRASRWYLARHLHGQERPNLEAVESKA